MIRTQMIYEALQQRLSEVITRLNRLPSRPVMGVENDNPERSEEALRIFMVRLWPQINNGKGTLKAKSEFLSCLSQLAGMALSQDWRFLDAWNNAYESIIKMNLSDRELRQKRTDVLQLYAFILETHVNNLALYLGSPRRL